MFTGLRCILAHHASVATNALEGNRAFTLADALPMLTVHSRNLMELIVHRLHVMTSWQAVRNSSRFVAAAGATTQHGSYWTVSSEQWTAAQRERGVSVAGATINRVTH